MSSLSSQIEFARDELRGVWRFRWVAIVIAWTVALLGWSVTYTLPDIYEARARVFVDTSTALRPLLEGLAISSDVQTQLDLVRQAMLSRPQLEKVAVSTDLMARASTPIEREALLDELERTISVTTQLGRGGDHLYSLTYQDINRDKSVEVVQTLLDTFVEDVIGGKLSGQETAQQFLREQIMDLERRLSEAEGRLSDFKKRNLGLVPGESGDYFSRLQLEEEQLARAKATLRLEERKREQLSLQLRGEVPYIPAGDSGQAGVGAIAGPGADTAARLREAESRLQEMLLRYTDRHPEVVALRESISELQARQAREVDALRQGDLNQSGGRAAFLNPVYQRIQVSMNDVDVAIASLRGDISDRERQVAELRRLADTAPEVEAEFARLNRDYGITKAQYESLVGRLESARLSEQAEQSGVMKFDVIDPPVAKLDPVAPNRGMLISAALLLGLVAGGGAAYTLHLLKPVFQNPRNLADVTGLPVLGAIGLAWPERHKSKRHSDMLRLAVGLSVLLMLYVVVLLTEHSVTNWVQFVLLDA